MSDSISLAWAKPNPLTIVGFGLPWNEDAWAHASTRRTWTGKQECPMSDVHMSFCTHQLYAGLWHASIPAG